MARLQQCRDMNTYLSRRVFDERIGKPRQQLKINTKWEFASFLSIRGAVIALKSLPGNHFDTQTKYIATKNHLW